VTYWNHVIALLLAHQHPAGPVKSPLRLLVGLCRPAPTVFRPNAPPTPLDAPPRPPWLAPDPDHPVRTASLLSCSSFGNLMNASDTIVIEVSGVDAGYGDAPPLLTDITFS
jgi:hypothetical protein